MPFQGTQGKYQARLLSNGIPVPLPSASIWSWECDDPDATITTDASDPTGATVELHVPITSRGERIALTASTTDPAGIEQSITFIVERLFTVSISEIP
jgi:hypothetical protein